MNRPGSLLLTPLIALLLAAGCDSQSALRRRADDQRFEEQLDQHRHQSNAELLELSQRVAANPRDDAILLRRAAAYMDRGEYGNAESDYAKVYRRSPMNYEALVGLVGACLRQDRGHIGQRIGKAGDVDWTVTAALERVVDEAPRYAPARYWLGQMYAVDGDYDQAIEAYDFALTLNPTYAAAYFARARAKMDRGDDVASAQQEEDAVDFGDLALKMLGIEKAGSDGSPSITRDLERAVFFDPRRTEYLVAGGLLAVDAGEFARAMPYLDRAVTVDPASAEAHLARGRANAGREKFLEALADYNRAERLDPDVRRLYFHRGVVNYELGRNYEAIEDLQEALDRSYAADDEDRWESSETHRYLGKVSLAADEPWIAEQQFDEAIEIDPTNAAAYEGRAEFYEAMGQTWRAREDRRKADQLRKD